MNFAEMKYRVRQLVGQTDTNSTVFDTTLDLEPAINDACMDVAARTETLLTYYDYETTAGTQVYSLKSDYLKLKAVRLFVAADDKRSIIHQSFDEFDVIEGGNPTRQGVPQYYKIETGATDTSNNLPGDLWLYPIPDSNGGSNYTLRVYYYQVPTKLTADDQTTELPIIAHRAVCFGAAATLSMMNTDRSAHQTMTMLFENEIRVIRSWAGIDQRDSAVRMKDTRGINRSSRVVRR